MKNLQIISILLFHAYLPGVAFAQDYKHVQYGPDPRQYMDIYIAPSAHPTPVYFDAHGNGGDIGMPILIVNQLKSNGISIVAWESLTSVGTPATVQTGWDDAELMFSWVKANAAIYNFDTTNFIIGGSSRGSVLSWKYGHKPNPNIKGLYMYNALPSSVWVDSTWWYPPNEVTVSSPPVFFVYLREPGSSTDPMNPDNHDPINGMKIMTRYNSLGIGDRDTLIHSLYKTTNLDKYQFLVNFALKVITRTPTGLNPIISNTSSLTVFPNPFQNSIEIQDLKGNEYFYIANVSGCILAEGHSQESLAINTLNPGAYYLIILSNSMQRVFKLIKK